MNTAEWVDPCAGTVKGLTSQQLVDLDCHVILGNTYHLENRPGSDIVAQMGGLHGFIGWPRGVLTDSGGFQVSNARSQPWSLCRFIHAKDNTVVRGKLRVGKIRGDWQVKASA